VPPTTWAKTGAAEIRKTPDKKSGHNANRPKKRIQKSLLKIKSFEFFAGKRGANDRRDNNSRGGAAGQQKKWTGAPEVKVETYKTSESRFGSAGAQIVCDWNQTVTACTEGAISSDNNSRTEPKRLQSEAATARSSVDRSTNAPDPSTDPSAICFP
jgi:hypothetical protein